MVLMAEGSGEEALSPNAGLGAALLVAVDALLIVSHPLRGLPRRRRTGVLGLGLLVGSTMVGRLGSKSQWILKSAQFWQPGLLSSH